MEITELTKRRVIIALENKKRFDGRNLLEYRPMLVEFGVSKNAEGSARVRLGDTEVYAGVKMSVGMPFTDSPESGVLVVTTELSPMASEKFEPGPPSIQSIELARIVDRGIRESGFLDLNKLCIKKGEVVWMVNLDIYPINDAGNLIDASMLASVAALQNAVFPKLSEDNKVQFGEFTTKKLPLTETMPLAVTIYRVGKSFIVDPTTEEEEASDSRLTFAISSHKKEENINALQKGGSMPFTVEEMDYIIDSAFKVYKKLNADFEEKIGESIKKKK